VEQHLARCPECATELKATRKFHATLSETVEEPTPNLLAASRMRLQEALETTRQGGFWQRIIVEPAVWLRQIRMAPALAAAIFIVGFGGGIGATYNFVAARGGENAVTSSLGSGGATANEPTESSAIAGIRSVTQEPGSNKVSIKYDTLSTQEAQGSLNDQRIQQLLLFAARSNYNSGVRLDSVDVLTQSSNDTHVRAALMYVLQNDSNPGVRLKALDGLSGFVKQDPQVRDEVLRALISDDNPGVRLQALRLVEPMKSDSNVRAVLAKLAQTDQNVSIRTQARAMLAQMPEMD
jgi:HEAT repeat protein